jgi:toxin ParE1/3/4
VKLVWSRPASDDRRQIREYIARDNPRAAIALDELISQKTRRLVDHPALGRPGRINGARELVVHRNYVLIYDVEGVTIRALRVLHAAQRWPPEES